MYEVSKTDLIEALRVVIAALPKARDGAPVLQNVLIESGDRFVRASGTDLVTFTSIEISATTEFPSVLRGLFDARGLLEFAKSVDGELVQFEENIGCSTVSDVVRISVGDAEKTEPRRDVGDFPTAPTHAEAGDWIPAAPLLRGLKAVAFAASTDESRLQLNSVGVDSGALVASDGKRLAEFVGANTSGKGLIPTKAVKVLLRHLKLEDDVFWTMDGETLRVRGTRGYTYTRLMKGQMPDYASLIPEEFSTDIRVDVKAFRKAVKAASAGLDKDARIVTIKVVEGDVILRSSTATVPVRAEVYGKRNGEWTFSVKFLLDPLAGLDAVSIGLQADHDGAAVLRSGGLRYAFMPVRK